MTASVAFAQGATHAERLLDHFVGQDEDGGWNSQPRRARLGIDDQLNSAGSRIGISAGF
jgi:hypothetical protein